MLPMNVVRAADAAATAANIPPANLLAVIEIESGGEVFAKVDGRDVPLILFEPAVFYRLLPEDKRKLAVEQKLASPKWDKSLYPKTQAGRYAQLARASLIDHDAAAEATSYGVGQVLGSNWKALGYESLDSFVRTVGNGVEGQIEVMLKFIAVNHLDDELRDGRWDAFARGYNGPKYKLNFYADRLAAAAKSYGGTGSNPAPDGMLRMGAKGAKVRAAQALLLRANIAVKQDGDFGLATKKAVMAFQTAHGITPDGAIGPETERELEKYRTGPEDKPGKIQVVDVDQVKQGSAGILGGVTLEGAKQAVNGATDQLQQVAGSVPIIDYLLAGLSVAAAVLVVGGLAWAAWGWFNSKKTVQP